MFVIYLGDCFIAKTPRSREHAEALIEEHRANLKKTRESHGETGEVAAEYRIEEC